jgi:hypothetical protein
MTTLREWQCVAPAHWNEAQLADYIRNSTVNLALGLAPVVQIASPLGAVNIILAVLTKIALENRRWVPQILDAMASVAEALDAETPPERIH